MSEKDSAVSRFQQLAAETRFQGPEMKGSQEVLQIPYFGKAMRELRGPIVPGGPDREWFPMLRWFGWVVVFGLTATGRVITLGQWKLGVNQISWELPPGGVHALKPGMTDAEILLHTQEAYANETGYGGGEWLNLGHTLIETGRYRGESMDDHGLKAHMFLAKELVPTGRPRNLHEGDIMEIIEVPLDEFYGVLHSGLFVEASAVPCAMKALIELGRKDLL